jgi:hypothetical protein
MYPLAGTESPAISDGRYRLVVYPDACEAYVTRPSWGGGGGSDSSVLDNSTQLDDEPIGDDATATIEDGRKPQSLRRSRSAIRRYSVANRLNVLVSPTYSDDHLDRASDRTLVQLDVRNLVRRMRWAWGESFPYVAMPEVQPERSEREGVPIYNGMVLVPRLPEGVFRSVIDGWGFGGGGGYRGVDITQWREKRGGAQYASKALSFYGSKSLGGAPSGQQAYRVGQGFQPVREVTEGVHAPPSSAVEVLGVWSEVYGVDLQELRQVRDDQGGDLDAAWAIW